MKRILYTAIITPKGTYIKYRLVVFCTKHGTLSYKLFSPQTGGKYGNSNVLTDKVLPIHYNEVFDSNTDVVKLKFDDLFSDRFIINESNIY